VIRAGSLDVRATWLTIIGVVVFGAGLSGFLPMIVVQVGSVIFAAGLVWLGVSLARRASSAAEMRMGTA